MSFTDVDGVRLYWEASGDGDPLLLIQGLGFSAAMWYRLLPALEEAVSSDEAGSNGAPTGKAAKAAAAAAALAEVGSPSED